MSVVDDDVLTIWTIYQRPRDFPGCEFVARASFIAGRGEPIRQSPLAKTAATLEGIRAQLPPGLFWMDRNPDDDPVIVEVWI